LDGVSVRVRVRVGEGFTVEVALGNRVSVTEGVTVAVALGRRVLVAEGVTGVWVGVKRDTERVAAKAIQSGSATSVPIFASAT
jgi:hypothetical protein